MFQLSDSVEDEDLAHLCSFFTNSTPSSHIISFFSSPYSVQLDISQIMILKVFHVYLTGVCTAHHRLAVQYTVVRLPFLHNFLFSMESIMPLFKNLETRIFKICSYIISLIIFPFSSFLTFWNFYSSCTGPLELFSNFHIFTAFHILVLFFCVS